MPAWLAPASALLAFFCVAVCCWALRKMRLHIGANIASNDQHIKQLQENVASNERLVRSNEAFLAALEDLKQGAA